MAKAKKSKQTRAEIRLAIEQLAERHGGRLTPALVVEAATNPASPLHSEFTWDNSVAAQKYREVQARRLIRSVEVRVTHEDHTIAAPVFVRDSRVPAGQQGYARLARVASDPAQARELLKYETSRAKAILTRAENIATVLGLSSEFTELMRAFAMIERKVLAVA